jgi:hypothetical protein
MFVAGGDVMLMLFGMAVEVASSVPSGDSAIWVTRRSHSRS